jgi:triacylglycerol esterase/lipase EstA (alpha/beta hydrolase family)
MIHEYLLIAYIRLLPFIKHSLPEEWSVGEKGTVVLIPGFHESNYCFLDLGNQLNKHGYRIVTIPDFKSTELVKTISAKLERFLATLNDSNIMLVSHSKGGIVAKYFLDNSAQSHKIKYSVSIATPYLGSFLAKLKYHNIWELSPDSELMKKLNRNASNNSKIINLYPKFDNHILPNKNLLLEGADNIKLDVNGHTRILIYKDLVNKVKSAVSGE